MRRETNERPDVYPANDNLTATDTSLLRPKPPPAPCAPSEAALSTAVPKIFRPCRASFRVTDSASPNGPVTNSPSRMAAPAFRMACEGLASRVDSVFIQLAFLFNRVVFVQRFVNLFPQANDRLCNGEPLFSRVAAVDFGNRRSRRYDLGNNQ